MGSTWVEASGREDDAPALCRAESKKLDSKPNRSLVTLAHHLRLVATNREAQLGRMSFTSQNGIWHIPSMSSVSEICQEAAKLPQSERAELAAFLLDSLEIERHWVDDAEIVRRSKEMSRADVQGLSWEQVKADCGRK